MLYLYGLEVNPPVRTVDLVIHALDLPYEYKIINFFKLEQLSPEFRKLNPLHTIPVIDDDGFILWDSHAIITYLVSKYGKDDSLYPKDLQKRAIVDQRLHYSNDVFNILKHITKNILFYNVKSVPEDQLAQIREHQANIEKLLEGHKFIAGDSLTVADYSYITLMDAYEMYTPGEDKYPLTKAWVERCSAVMKDFDKVNKNGAEILIDSIKKKLSS